MGRVPGIPGYKGAQIHGYKRVLKAHCDEASSLRWVANWGLKYKALTCGRVIFLRKSSVLVVPREVVGMAGCGFTHSRYPPATDIPECSSLPGPRGGDEQVRMGCRENKSAHRQKD